jgi:MoaA/NifB/PqqE/SkfB family radical SAM enzyme
MATARTRQPERNDSMAVIKAKPTEPVMVFQWHITDQCDQRCTHCYIFGEDPCKTLYSAPFDRMKEVVDRCMEYTAPTSECLG